MAIAQIKVAPFRTVVARKEVFGGYHVQALYCAARSAPFEWIGHPAVFATKERAEAFMAKIETALVAKKGCLNMQAWGNGVAAYGVI
jgi:hypothetical protein